MAIALKYFGIELSEGRKKGDLTAALEKEIAAKPTALASVTAPDDGPALSAETGALSEQDLLRAAGYGSSDEDEEDE